MEKLSQSVSARRKASGKRRWPLVSLPIGTRLAVGETIVEVTQIGKECHTRCAIFYQAGDCVMPKEGIFVKVLKGGVVRTGDPIHPMDS